MLQLRSMGYSVARIGALLALSEPATRAALDAAVAAMGAQDEAAALDFARERRLIR